MRRKKHCAQVPHGFHDRQAAFLPLDIDDIPVSMWTANPRKTVDDIVRRLGEPFTETSYVAQLTGSHGLVRADDGRWTGEVGGDVMSVRLFFMTERGIGADEARAWLELLRDTAVKEIDASVAGRVHIIYLARPRWHDHEQDDPLGDIKPCWMVKRKQERLPVPEDLEARTRWQQTSMSQTMRVSAYTDIEVEEAVASIGLPLSDGGPGCIYDRLLWAARLLTAAHPLNGHDIEAHAWNLRDQLAQMIADARDRIEANLIPANAKAARASLDKYLQDDVHRWIHWLFEHGATGKKKVRRGVVEQDHGETGGHDVLTLKRELADQIGDDLVDDNEELLDALAEREAEPTKVLKVVTGERTV